MRFLTEPAGGGSFGFTVTGVRLTPRQLTAAVLAILVCGVILSVRHEAVVASEGESATWGAIDPTWSPDGARLAFSLFGSIWVAPAEGGIAQQVTASNGYHAHAAWSPKGDRIAFINGRNPVYGALPNVSGTLMLVDVASGAEQEIRTPHRVSGTLAWSPDGNRIACALLSSDSGAVVYEVDLAAGGAAKPVQELPLRLRDGSSWINLAWNPKRDEIYFTAQRGGEPQIWSVPPRGPVIVVQMPLTRYRPEDIVMLHSISALPDGTGVVYSADIVNGRGNYELYRLGRAGGAPAAITHTDRDEFSPAVSPDGKRVALVSNRLGNIDLFVMPVSGGEAKHVRLTGLKFRKPSSQLRVRVLDESGNPTPARVYVRASDGKAYCPAGSPIFYYGLDPGQGREGFFLSHGDDTFPLPAGQSRLVAIKGLEYDIAERTIDVAAGDIAETTIQMQRWTNWNQRGWYSGENHFHANYNGSYYQTPVDSLQWLEAMDLNAANMMVANSRGAFIHDKEFFRGRVDPLSKSRYVLYWGEEYRNSFPLGHMLFLNIRKLVPPFFTSVPGSNSPYDFPMNTMAALEARKQGGVVSYAHPADAGMRDIFDTRLGAKEIPIGAALGSVDLIDVLPLGQQEYELWYRLLNCGFRIAPGAGTDVFTNWRGIRRMPGSQREYVEVGGPMDWEKWVSRLRKGRVFVTNGPLLSFSVNGSPMGSVIRIPEGQTYRAKLTADISSRVPVRLVEFLQNGKVIESRELTPEARVFRLEKEVSVEQSCWFAVRVTGRPARGVDDGLARAHSAAVYLEAGGRPTLVKEDIELMIRWVDRLWALLEERNNFGPGENREAARKMFEQARSHYRSKLEKAF